MSIGKTCGDRRGVALMLVLWVVIVLSVIAAGVVALSRSQVDLVATIRSRAVARYAAESGVVAATARLGELLRSAGSPEDQVRAFLAFKDELANGGERVLGAARYQVVMLDLGARVDLNNSTDAVLLGLFEQLLGEREANTLVDALRDWVDEDGEALPYGAEVADYVRAGSRYRPSNGPIRRLEEVTRIKGFTDSIVGVIAPFVTLWGDGRVNVNTAPWEVLAAVPELGPGGADLLLTAREGGDVMASKVAVSSRLAESGSRVGAQLMNLTTVPGHILIVSRGWEDGHPLTHEIQAVYQVLRLQLGEGPRLRVRYWSERDL